MPTSPRRFRVMFRADRVVRPYTRLPMTRTLYVRGDVGIAPYEITGGVCVYISGGQIRPPLQLKRRRINFYRGRDQRQRRRRRDDPFDRTTKSNPRDRVVQTANNRRA